MTAVEIALILILAVTGGYVSVTDIMKRIIPNQVLLLAGIPGVILNIIYYCLFYPEGRIFSIYFCFLKWRCSILSIYTFWIPEP